MAFTVSISGISSLGQVTGEDVTVDNNLIRLPIPTQDSAEVIVVNLLGKERRINLTGNFAGTEAQMTAFVTDINNWVNNGTQTARTYNGALIGSISVMCDNFTYSLSNTDPFVVNYTLTLIEGGVVQPISSLISAVIGGP